MVISRIAPLPAINVRSRLVSTAPGSRPLAARPVAASGPNPYDALFTGGSGSRAGKPKSLLGQLGAMAKGLVPGVAHFVKDALTDVVAVPRVASDVLGGHGLRNIGAYLPASTGVLKSFGRTGYDITHPGEFAKAVREGTIVSKIFEDLGNVAVIAGPAAKAIGAGGVVAGEAGEAASAAAREGVVRELAGGQYRGLAGVAERAGNVPLAQSLQRVGNTVRTVGTFGEMPGNAIAKPFEWAGKGLVRGGEALGLDRVVAPIVERARTAASSALERDFSDVPGLRTLSRVNRAFKTFQLPFSAKFHIGNEIGVPLQAYFHGGVGPIELTKYAGKIIRSEGEGNIFRGVRNLWRNSGSPAWANEELTQGSLARSVGIEGEGSNVVSRGVRKAASASYKFNSAVDNLARHSMMLAKRAAGETEDQAYQSVNRAFGNYASLKPAEQTLARQVLPFYPWLRHSIGATLRMPLSSPGRAMFLGGLSARYNDPNNPTSPLIGQRLPFGSRALNLGTGVPFADVSPVGFALSPLTLTGQLSPALKTLSTLGLGIDPRDLGDISRPGSTKALDEFGQPTRTPPWKRLLSDPRHALGEIIWQLAQQGPTPVRETRNLILGNAQRYSGTGYEYAADDPNRARWLSLLRAAGIPTLDPISQGG